MSSLDIFGSDPLSDLFGEPAAPCEGNAGEEELEVPLPKRKRGRPKGSIGSLPRGPGPGGRSEANLNQLNQNRAKRWEGRVPVVELDKKKNSCHDEMAEATEDVDSVASVLFSSDSLRGNFAQSSDFLGISTHVISACADKLASVAFEAFSTIQLYYICFFIRST